MSQLRGIEGEGLRTVLHLVGWILVGVSFSQVVPLTTAVVYSEPLLPFLVTAAAGVAVGLPLTRLPLREDMRAAEGMVFVTLTWVAVPALGTIPYLVSGTFPSFTDAFFESMSGFTTTGSTVLTDFGQPRSVMLWRQFSQWMGGMGIIVLFVAILPRLSIGGRQLLEAEAPGPALEKLTPRIRDTAKLLWSLYVGFTALEFALLLASGLSPYDALAHAFTTMPTGGFSPRPGGISEFGLTPRAVITAFMFVAGVNFALTYRAIAVSPGELLEDAEFWFYVKVAGAAIVVLSTASYLAVHGTVPASVVNGAFQAVTVITSTGYASVDFSEWPWALQSFLFLLMFTGGSAGSTGGGVKMVRLLVLYRVVLRELSRSLHPRAVIPLNLDGKSVSDDVVNGVAAFVFSYVALFLLGTFAVAGLSALHGLEVDLVTASTSSIATLGNIGPGLGEVGPMDNFAFFPPVVKWVLSFLMLAGRLEVLTVLALLTPGFWRGR